MAIKAVTKNPSNTSARILFEERLLSIGSKVQQGAVKKKEGFKFNKFRLFCNYIIIRTYSKYITVHAWGDNDANELKRINYTDIKYNLDDLQFIAWLLDERT